MVITIGKRILAGLWFLIAAGLVIVPLFILTADFANIRSVFVIWLSPFFISALVGSFLGAEIVDPQRTKNGLNAALRGFLVAIISFLLYAVARSAWEAYVNHGDLTQGEVFVGTIIMILWAAALIGWVIMVIGALAGLVLYLVFSPRESLIGRI